MILSSSIFYQELIMAIYMKINGIDGHVTTQNYDKWIELDSIGFNVNRSLSTTTGNVSDRERTKPTLSEISVTKEIDQTSPHLFSAACGIGKGKQAIDKIEIHVCHTSGNGATPYAKYTLNNVLFSNYQIQGDKKCESVRPQESIALNYDKIEMEYTPHNEKHSSGSPTRAGFDLKTGKEAAA
jgi:type VI secretion system secreted protein Hcp